MGGEGGNKRLPFHHLDLASESAREFLDVRPVLRLQTSCSGFNKRLQIAASPRPLTEPSRLLLAASYASASRARVGLRQFRLRPRWFLSSATTSATRPRLPAPDSPALFPSMPVSASASFASASVISLRHLASVIPCRHLASVISLRHLASVIPRRPRRFASASAISRFGHLASGIRSRLGHLLLGRLPPWASAPTSASAPSRRPRPHASASAISRFGHLASGIRSRLGHLLLGRLPPRASAPTSASAPSRRPRPHASASAISRFGHLSPRSFGLGHLASVIPPRSSRVGLGLPRRHSSLGLGLPLASSKRHSGRQLLS